MESIYVITRSPEAIIRSCRERRHAIIFHLRIARGTIWVNERELEGQYFVKLIPRNPLLVVRKSMDKDLNKWVIRCNGIIIFELEDPNKCYLEYHKDLKIIVVKSSSKTEFIHLRDLRAHGMCQTIRETKFKFGRELGAITIQKNSSSKHTIKLSSSICCVHGVLRDKDNIIHCGYSDISNATYSETLDLYKKVFEIGDQSNPTGIISKPVFLVDKENILTIASCGQINYFAIGKCERIGSNFPHVNRNNKIYIKQLHIIQPIDFSPKGIFSELCGDGFFVIHGKDVVIGYRVISLTSEEGIQWMIHVELCFRKVCKEANIVFPPKDIIKYIFGFLRAEVIYGKKIKV